MSMWITAAGLNMIFAGLISADQALKIAKDAALLIGWVLVVAALWAVGERLVARLRKRP